MLFSRNDTASCRRPRRRGVPFSVEAAERPFASQWETSPRFAEFPKSPSRFLGWRKLLLLRMNLFVIVFPLPPPSLWNTVRVQQILCSSFLGICQITLPVKVGSTYYPLQNNPHIAPWFRRSALFCGYPWVLTPTKTRLKWTSTEWVLV